MRCANCGAKVRVRDHVCPCCDHLLANDVTIRRILWRVAIGAVACLLLLGVGIFVGASL